MGDFEVARIFLVRRAGLGMDAEGEGVRASTVDRRTMSSNASYVRMCRDVHLTNQLFITEFDKHHARHGPATVNERKSAPILDTADNTLDGLQA